MKNSILGLLSASLIIAAPAFADSNVQKDVSIKHNADGTFKESSHIKGTDASGAAFDSSVERKEGKTLLGKNKSTTTTESSTDPVGLGNKSWKKTDSTVISDNRGNTEKEVISKSVDSAGTRRKVIDEVDTAVNSDGSSKTTISRETVTDPKGLMNKQVSKTEETVRRAADGTITRESERSVN